MRKVLLLALSLLVVAGCGEKSDYTRIAETEGIYVDAGNLVYQVQISRFLNPGNIDDFEYLQGLPAGTDRAAPPGETWFGVWMRVKNYTDDTITPTSGFKIVDTEENEYEPIVLDDTNVFRYNPLPLGPDNVLPRPDSAAASGPIQGSLILFKLKVESLQNRPLVLEIDGGSPEQSAEVDLDL
jgi:hypothetical protein